MSAKLGRDPASWAGLSWSDLRVAANARGLQPMAAVGLSSAQRAALVEKTIASLCAWYEWSEDRPAPEALLREELAVEAAALHLMWTTAECSEGDLKSLHKSITRAHLLLKIDHDLAGGGSSQDSDDLPDPAGPEAVPTYMGPAPPPPFGPVQEFPAAAVLPGIALEDGAAPEDSAPHLEELGYPYSNSAGRAVKCYPMREPDRPINTRARIPKEVSDLFGTVIAVHKIENGYPCYDGEYGLIQDFRVVTGLTHGSHPLDFRFEIFHLQSQTLSSLSKRSLLKLDEVESEEVARALASEFLADSDEEDGNFSTGSYFTGNSAQRGAFKVIVRGLSFSLPGEYKKLMLLPRILDAAGKDPAKATKRASSPAKSEAKPTPGVKAAFTDLRDEEKVDRAQALRKLLADCMAPVLAGLARKLEPYEQPKNENLVTGAPLDVRLSEAEKLFELGKSYSMPTEEQNVCNFCLSCTTIVLEEARGSQDLSDLQYSRACSATLSLGPRPAPPAQVRTVGGNPCIPTPTSPLRVMYATS
jgi:hypothetical protein